MTEIDHLQRITLRDLKPFFTACRKIKEQVDEYTEGKSMGERLDFVERNSQKIRHLLRWDVVFTRSNYFGETKRVLDVEAIIDPLDIEIIGFWFRWKSEDDGSQTESRIAIERVPSNLGLNPVRYFVCPYSNRRCRKLFTDWRVFSSRWAFDHTYSQRNYSKRWRQDKKLWDMVSFLDDEKNLKGRKERYRGRLTPYGRKIKKLVGGETYEEIKAHKNALLESLLLPYRRGRPPKR